jgi:hypothetical protein
MFRLQGPRPLPSPRRGVSETVVGPSCVRDSGLFLVPGELNVIACAARGEVVKYPEPPVFRRRAAAASAFNRSPLVRVHFLPWFELQFRRCQNLLASLRKVIRHESRFFGLRVEIRIATVRGYAGAEVRLRLPMTPDIEMCRLAS